MSEPSPASHSGRNADTSLPPVVPASPWARIKEHKVLQWSLAYLGAALALAHGQELLAHAFHWPELVGRALIAILIVGFPIAVALAWYHGHKGMTRFSAPEATVVALLVVIAAILLTALVKVPEERAGSVTSAPAVPPAQSASPVPAASVAVVPFTNLTGEAGKEYFSDGMAEELINELTKVPGLKVPARTSSFAYKGRNTDIRQIARDLGVATILEGSVRSAGERIRVTAQLINAQSGYHIWSNTYEGNFGDVFKVQDEISGQIVAALRNSLNAQLPAVNPQAAPTADPEAYRLYLQGRYAPPEVSVRLMSQAVSRDPRLARAWATLAIQRVAMAAFGAVIANGLVEAERDANQALALDPDLADAQVALASVSAWRGDWNAAELSFRRAVELAPSDPVPRAYRSATLSSSVGHLHQSLLEMQQAYALAPAATGVIASLAATYSLAGQDGEALKVAKLSTELGDAGNLSVLARQNAALRSGRYVEAAEIVLPALPAALNSHGASATVKQVFAAFGAAEKAATASHSLTMLVRNVKPDQLGVQPRQEIITWYVMLGDLDTAFEFANRSLDEFARAGTVGTTWGVLWLPEMRPFRLDLRFQAFVARLKLFDYWKQYGPPDDCNLVGERLVCR